jgi:hypothetical protein
VLDAATGLQCAELLARWSVARFAKGLDRLGRRYNDALLAVERNNHGHAVLLELEHHRRYPRLYRHTDGALGWLMNAQTRPLAIQSLAAMLRDAPQTFCSKRLLEQCRAFSDSRDSAEHDDLVIAAAIAHAVRSHTPVKLLAVTT